MAEASNTEVVQFPEPTGVQPRPTHYAVFAGNTRLCLRPLTDAVAAPIAGANVSFPVGELVFEVPVGETSSEFVVAILTMYFNATNLTVRLYSDAGATELVGFGYAAQQINAGGMTVAG